VELSKKLDGFFIMSLGHYNVLIVLVMDMLKVRCC